MVDHYPKPVVDWLSRNDFGQVVEGQSVGGGCINHASRIRASTGMTFFLKTNHSAPADMFSGEAGGLTALQAPGGAHIPTPYLHGSDFLLMEDLSPAARRPDYWPVFGRQLALLHNQTQARFGFFHDNYIGSTPQPNHWTEDGYSFFLEQRLMFQARMAHQSGLLPFDEVDQVERLARRLPDLIPVQPASLIHGDLWSGNAITDAGGWPALIDPAVHYGWAEAELAMTALFGSFPDTFYRAYQEIRPLEKNFRHRFPIYNLYHLLNHLNLFGLSYKSAVNAILKEFD